MQTEPTSAIYGHCVRVYTALFEESKSQMITTTQGPDEKQHVQTYVWEGFLTHLFKKLSLSVPYYTMVMRELKRMDCVRQVRRGGSTTPSQWLLVQPPTEQLFAARALPTPQARREDQQAQMIRDLSKRVAELEQERGMVS